MTTATAPTTPQMNDLIDWMQKNNRAARVLVQFLTLSAKWRREIFIFEVLTTTRARSMKTIRVKQAKVHFAYFVQRYQHSIIANCLTQRKVPF